jgi:DNA-binding beta-propeller fold protein YncE
VSRLSTPSILRTNSPSGNAALSPDETTLLVDNLTTKNFDVYRLPDNVPSTFLPFSSTRRFPKQCIFSGGAKVAVCGSDNNSVYVVDVTTSEGIQTLRCGEGSSKDFVHCRFADRYFQLGR